MVGARCAGSGYFGIGYVAGSNPVIDLGVDVAEMEDAPDV